jgi:hypothetical protein
MPLTVVHVQEIISTPSTTKAKPGKDAESLFTFADREGALSKRSDLREFDHL